VDAAVKSTQNRLLIYSSGNIVWYGLRGNDQDQLLGVDVSLREQTLPTKFFLRKTIFYIDIDIGFIYFTDKYNF
jgi:hypothetical protein